MNNKGFAITTIIFGILILFIMLVTSLLGILSTCHNNLRLLVDNNSGSRDIITLKKIEYASYNALINSNIKQSGLYCFNDTHKCQYVSRKKLTEK